MNVKGKNEVKTEAGKIVKLTTRGRAIVRKYDETR